MTREEMLGKVVGVIYGGVSSERDVSLKTGAAVGRALKARGYRTEMIDYTGAGLVEHLRGAGVDVAYLALHGAYGEDGAVQGLLEVLEIPYTGAKVFGSALAMDKHASKVLFREAGLPVAAGLLLREGEPLPELPFDLPVVVKPNADGSSVGVTLVKNEQELDIAVKKAFLIESRILIEPYISGKEVSVSILDGKALGVIWIKPAREFYDYDAKYLTNDTEYIYPAPLRESVYRRCLEIGEAACRVVRGEGAMRCDLIVPEDGNMVVLEVNTLPGMTDHSLVPKTAAACGIAFDELVERILLGASLGLRPARRGTESGR